MFTRLKFLSVTKLIFFSGDGLKDLKMLKVLNLATNNICDVKSQDLKICSNLVFLDLSNNNLKTFKVYLCLFFFIFLTQP